MCPRNQDQSGSCAFLCFCLSLWTNIHFIHVAKALLVIFKNSDLNVHITISFHSTMSMREGGNETTKESKPGNCMPNRLQISLSIGSMYVMMCRIPGRGHAHTSPHNHKLRCRSRTKMQGSAQEAKPSTLHLSP